MVSSFLGEVQLHRASSSERINGCGVAPHKSVAGENPVSPQEN